MSPTRNPRPEKPPPSCGGFSLGNRGVPLDARRPARYPNSTSRNRTSPLLEDLAPMNDLFHNALTRRGFLRAGAATTLAAFGVPALASADDNKEEAAGFRLGAQTYTFRKFPFEQALKRTHELGLLVNALHRALRDRIPQLVTVLGRAGIGKSRLVRELYLHSQQMLDRPIAWRTGRCPQAPCA